MAKMEVERIIKLGMDTYNHKPCEEIEERLYRVRAIDKNCLIAGLIFLYDMNEGYVKLYKDMVTRQGEEIAQLKEKINSLQRENSLLNTNSCKLSTVTKSCKKNHISYRADVDTMAIHSLLEQNYSKSEIAKKLGVSRQTIYRRLEENK